MNETSSRALRNLRFDSSPWIVPVKNWAGISVGEMTRSSSGAERTWDGRAVLEDSYWLLRDDTFPSNLALFTDHNVSVSTQRVAQLALRQEHTPVRTLTSAAIASRLTFCYGRFSVELKPPNVRGLITGIFLYRNGPRQEIDLEFLGRDTTQILVNVYFNPGIDGTKLEYGYR